MCFWFYQEPRHLWPDMGPWISYKSPQCTCPDAIPPFSPSSLFSPSSKLPTTLLQQFPKGSLPIHSPLRIIFQKAKSECTPLLKTFQWLLKGFRVKHKLLNMAPVTVPFLSATALRPPLFSMLSGLLPLFFLPVPRTQSRAFSPWLVLWPRYSFCLEHFFFLQPLACVGLLMIQATYPIPISPPFQLSEHFVCVLQGTSRHHDL